MINSPDLCPLFSIVGIGGLVAARAVDSDTDDTVIEPPSGITISVQNRVATASGRLVFFSDPVAIDGGDIRSFVGFNVNQRPGLIYGMHEIEAGLVCVTTVGTYLLDADAFAVAQVGMNGTAWRLLSTVSAHSYNSTCVHNGRVYALTETGWIACDTQSNDETELSDETMPRARGPAIQLPDYRTCRMMSAQAGPIIAAPQIGAVHVVDLAHDVASWWRDTSTSPGDLRGILTDHFGGEIWAMATGLYRVVGDFDGEVALTSHVATQPVGTLYGSIPTAADANVMPRKINVAAAVDGALHMFAAVRGSEHEGDDVDPDPMGIIIGEDDWGEAAPKRWTSTPLANMQADFGDVEDTAATRDVSIEVSAKGALVRLSVMPTMTPAKSATTRPQSGG